MNISYGLLVLLYAFISIYLINFSTWQVVKNNKEYFNKHLSLKNRITIFILIKTLILFFPLIMIRSLFDQDLSNGGGLGIFFGAIIGIIAIVVLLIAFKIRDVFYARKLKKKINNPN